MSRITVTAPTTTRDTTDWRDQAACRGEDPDLFFPYPGETIRIEAAKAVCRGCPVWAQCLQWATEQRVEGVWGGTTEDERRPRRGRGRKHTGKSETAQCGTESGAQRHRRHHERVCDACRRGERKARRRREQAKTAEVAA